MTSTIPEPNYNDGYRAGQRDQAARDERRRIADVLDRDADTVDTLRAQAAVIRSALGRTQSRQENYPAVAAADTLVKALETLMAALRGDVAEHRREAE